MNETLQESTNVENDKIKTLDQITQQSEQTLDHITKLSYAAIILFSSMLLTFVVEIVYKWKDLYWIGLIGSLVMGMLVADFVSGVMHWTFDTWGSSDTLFWGEYIVKSFREHHSKPHMILKRGWIESNGIQIVLVTLFHIFYIIFLEDNLPVCISDSAYKTVFLMVVYMMISVTNEIHKLCHYPKRCGYFVETLRLLRIIPNFNEHKKHHSYPFDDNYCLSTGWMNPILRRFQFWRKVEYYVTKFTGMIPRNEDLKVYESNKTKNKEPHCLRERSDKIFDE